MECPEENVLLDFIRGELDDQSRHEVEIHIDSCLACGQVLAELARIERDSDDYVEPTLGEEEEEEDDDDDDKQRSPAPRFHLIRLEQGSTLGPYVVLDQIGAGGMGIVYAAYDPRLDRKIALKLLMGSPGGSLPKEHAELRARLQREAQAMARLNHPHVITVHDVGEVDGQLFLAMEFVDGGTLKDWMHKGPHPWREALDMFIAAGDGLAAAHAAGLVHRDFKPDNVLLGVDGRVLVTDFGLARPIAGRTDAFMSVPAAEKLPVMSAQLTMTGELVGTPAYMAPEQLAGKRSDALGDQFSFCVALYEAFYGERPFEGKLLGELIANVSSGTVRTTKRDAQVPRRFRKVLLQGLQPNAEDRHADMHELLAKLRDDPGRRWRTTAAITLPAALLSIGVGAYISDDEGPLAYCDDLEVHFAGVWDRERRSSLESTFLRSKESYAADSYKATARYLDQYASRWQQLQSDACRAEGDGKVPAPVLALRMSCLEQHRRRFDALVDVLQVADRNVLVRAVDAVSRLPDPTECLDVERVSTELAGLGSESDRRTRMELEGDLARAEALRYTARYAEAETLASEIAGRARQSKDVWAEAEGTVLRAEVEELMGQADLAGPRYHQAFSQAIESGHAEVMVRVAVGLLWMGGDSTNDAAELQRQFANGRAALVRLGGDADLESRLFNAAGRALMLQREYAIAEQYLRHALANSENTFGPDHPSLAEPLSSLGQLMAEQGEFDKAQAIFERVLVLGEREFGREHPNVAVACDNLGAVLAEQGELEGALVQFRRALAIKEGRLSVTHPHLATSHRNIAIALYRLGAADEARSHAEAALSVRAEEGTASREHLIASHAVMASILRTLGESHAAVQHAQQAEQAAKILYGDAHPGYAEKAVEWASALLGAGRAEEAIGPADKAVTICRAADGVSPVQLAQALTTLASAEIAAGRAPDKAISVASEAVEILAASHVEPNDRDVIAEAQLVLAQALEASGTQPQRVRDLAEQAHQQFAASDRVEDAARARALIDALPPA